MRAKWSVVAAACVIAACASVVIVGARPAPAQLEPPADRGKSITPAFEGWYKNSDGTFTLLLGYFNRNSKQILEIPVGPNNRIEPGGPDQGQPTYFAPRRAWGVFTITVPKDFGTKKLTWTITANGETTSVPVSLNPPYEVSPFKDLAMGNTPPVLKFTPDGPSLTGPPRGIAATYEATSTQPATIEFWASDKGNTQGAPSAGRGGAISLSLHKFRGPGDIKFANERPRMGEDGKVSTTASFSAPGDYVVRVQANDSSGDGGGGFQCCWTNAHVKVTVK